jgi:hypothetical protein
LIDISFRQGRISLEAGGLPISSAIHAAISFSPQAPLSTLNKAIRSQMERWTPCATRAGARPTAT